MKTSQEIHDMIQQFQIGGSHERVTSELLDVLTALNERMDEIERDAKYACDIAVGVANQVKPD